MKSILFMRLVRNSIAVLVWLLGMQSSEAGMILSIDLDPANGIQSSRSVFATTPFQANLVLELTGTTTLDAYRVSVTFDAAGLNYINGTSTPLTGYSPQAGPLTRTGNILSPLEAAANVIGQEASAPLGPIVIGSFNFTTLGTLGSFDITPFEINGLDGSFDTSNSPIAATFHAGTITTVAVPEPSGLILMGSLPGLYFLRRRNK